MPAIVMPAVIVRSLLCHLHCAIYAVDIVGNIASGRRGAAMLGIVATFPPSELLLTS